MKLTPENKKVALAVVTTIAIGTVLYFALKPRGDQEYLEDPTGNDGIINNPASFSPSIAAERLYEAMRYMGTDESAIMSVFQTVSVANFTKVYTLFGKRSYNSVTGDQRRYNPFKALPLENLQVWLKSELSANSYETLRLKYKSTNLL